LFHLLSDADLIVRTNAARALMEQPGVGALLEQAFISQDARAVETLIRVIEQDRRRQLRLFDLIVREQLVVTRTTMIMSSAILRKRFADFLQESERLAGDAAVAAI